MEPMYLHLKREKNREIRTSYRRTSSDVTSCVAADKKNSFPNGCLTNSNNIDFQ